MDNHNDPAPAQDIPWVLMAQLSLWITMVNQTASSAGFTEPFRIMQNTARANTRVTMRALAGIADASLVVQDVAGRVVREGFRCNQDIRTILHGHRQPDGSVTFDSFGYHRTSSDVYGGAEQSTFDLHNTGLLWLTLEFTFKGARYASRIQSAFVFAKVPPHDSPFREYLHTLGQAFPHVYPAESERLTCGPLIAGAARTTYVAECIIPALHQQAALHAEEEVSPQLAQDANVQLGEGDHELGDIPIPIQEDILEQAALHAEEEVDPQGNVLAEENPRLGAPHLYDFNHFYERFNTHLDAIDNPIEPVDEAGNAVMREALDWP